MTPGAALAPQERLFHGDSAWHLTPVTYEPSNALASPTQLRPCRGVPAWAHHVTDVMKERPLMYGHTQDKIAYTECRV